MYKNYFFVLFLYLNIFCDLINAYTSKNCTNVEKQSSMFKLRRNLLCEYNSGVRPVQTNKNVTRMGLRVVAGFMEYNHKTQIFGLHTLTILTWEDMHLRWKPKDYDGISRIRVSINEVWVPDILLYNEYEYGKNVSTYQPIFTVNNYGSVLWGLHLKHSVYCIGDTTWWPYDLLNCTLQYGSWSYSNDEVEIFAEVYNVDWTEDPEWHLVRNYITMRVEQHKYNLGSTIYIASYHFILRRNWGIICITYVTPTIVLMVMTLITLWLEPKSTERMIMANLNFICHLLCMKGVHREMPHNGFNIPKLLIFYESSFAIASFTLILTSILRYLQELRSEPPGWISAVTMSISHSKVGQILLFNVLDPVTAAKIQIYADDNTDLVQMNNKKSSWMHVTVLIGWLALLSIFLTYIILLSISFSV